MGLIEMKCNNFSKAVRGLGLEVQVLANNTAKLMCCINWLVD